jgi:cytidine deaminase
MSLNPFAVDPRKRERYLAFSKHNGATLSDEIVRLLTERRADPISNLGSVLLATEAAALVAKFELVDAHDLMVLGLDAARRIARPTISDFHVGSIGLEAETGNLILGGNVEFEGTGLGFTLHGEGFVFTRAFSRGTTISVIAIGEAHPCAHCRQYLSEFATSSRLELTDPLGHTLTMAQLYPWPFDPDYLGEPGIVSDAVPFPNLTFTGTSPPTAPVASALLVAGRRAHTPYSKSPSAIVLRCKDDSLFTGSAIESVAFNPSMGALQAAIVDLLAHGRGYHEIVEGALGCVMDGQVRPPQSAAELLGRIAPEAILNTYDWQP